MPAQPIIFDHTGTPARRRVGAHTLYDSSPSTRRRSTYIPDVAQDIETLVSSYDRNRLLSIGRALYSTMGVVTGALNSIATYAIGDAMRPFFTGKDQAFGAELLSFLDLWFANCNVQGAPYDFVTCLWLASVSIDRDGDVAIILTSSEDGEWPLIQLIPSHRIGNRTHEPVVGSGPYKGLPIRQGVITSRSGRPVALNILGDDPADDKQVSLRDSMLVYEPSWVDQSRGIPGMASTVRDFLDSRTVTGYELDALKALSSVAVIEHNETGSADPDLDPGTQHFADSGDAVNPPQTGITVEELDGGTIRYFRSNSGAGLSTLSHDRPNANAQEFLSGTVLRAAFSGLGWPIELAWNPSGLTGPAVRLTIGKAARKIENRQRRLYAVWQRCVTYAIAKAIKSKRLPRHKEWLAVDATFPRSLTIDAGRESAATLSEMKSGVTNLAEVVGKDGRDWRQVIDARVAEQVYIREACAKAGIDPSSVSDLAQQQQTP